MFERPEQETHGVEVADIAGVSEFRVPECVFNPVGECRSRLRRDRWTRGRCGVLSSEFGVRDVSHSPTVTGAILLRRVVGARSPV